MIQIKNILQSLGFTYQSAEPVRSESDEQNPSIIPSPRVECQRDRSHPIQPPRPSNMRRFEEIFNVNRFTGNFEIHPLVEGNPRMLMTSRNFGIIRSCQEHLHFNNDNSDDNWRRNCHI